jgi:predicted nucleic-acid-binding protein
MVKHKLFLDTNAVIHFNMADNPEKFNRVANILITRECHVPIEVITEAVFVLEKSFGLDRQIIADKLKDFIRFQENLVPETTVVLYGLNLYAATNFDIIDCLLAGYAKINSAAVFTFDDDLKKQLGSQLFRD